MDKLTVSGLGSGKVDGKVSALSLMANAFYDFIPQSTVCPFIGAGIGYASVKADIDDFGDDSANTFAYQAAAGVTFALNKRVNVDLQYRYFATTDPKFESAFGDIESEYSTHNAMLGLRYTF